MITFTKTIENTARVLNNGELVGYITKCQKRWVYRAINSNDPERPASRDLRALKAKIVENNGADEYGVTTYFIPAA